MLLCEPGDAARPGETRSCGALHAPRPMVWQVPCVYQMLGATARLVMEVIWGRKSLCYYEPPDLPVCPAPRETPGTPGPPPGWDDARPGSLLALTNRPAAHQVLSASLRKEETGCGAFDSLSVKVGPTSPHRTFQKFSPGSRLRNTQRLLPACCETSLMLSLSLIRPCGPLRLPFPTSRGECGFWELACRRRSKASWGSWWPSPHEQLAKSTVFLPAGKECHQTAR